MDGGREEERRKQIFTGCQVKLGDNTQVENTERFFFFGFIIFSKLGLCWIEKEETNKKLIFLFLFVFFFFLQFQNWLTAARWANELLNDDRLMTDPPKFFDVADEEEEEAARTGGGGGVVTIPPGDSGGEFNPALQLPPSSCLSPFPPASLASQ